MFKTPPQHLSIRPPPPQFQIPGNNPGWIEDVGKLFDIRGFINGICAVRFSL